jgi:hypothetical protein
MDSCDSDDLVTDFVSHRRFFQSCEVLLQESEEKGSRICLDPGALAQRSEVPTDLPRQSHLRFSLSLSLHYPV